MAKLAPKCHGPFKVIQVMSPVNYRLELLTQWNIHDVFHTDLLTPYRKTPMHGANYQHPPPNLVEGVEEYEVERILDSRRHGRGRKLQYLIAWKGYPDSDNQWVNWDDTEGAHEAIQEFKRSNPDRETHIKASIESPRSPSPTRIGSMSTSPSLTANWNFDTPENRAAWDVVTCPSSYFTPTVTYSDNNNVDDAATYNDCHQGRQSPGIASDILEHTTTLRDMEEPKATFRISPLPAMTTMKQADPPFWKTVADAWADNFLFRAYIRQEKKQALLASLPATLHTPTPPSSSTAVTKKTTTSSVGDAKTPSPTATAVPLCSPHASTSTKKKTTKKPQFPPPKPRTKKIDPWRYVSAKEWAERQTMEEEFRRITEGCMHLGPRSARRAVPYPPCLTVSYATEDKITSLSVSPPLMDEALPQPSGSKFAWD
jgi:hypothetical protein